MLTISSGYDPGYLTRSVAAGRENYYLSAVAEHGEPPGIWTGLGCPELSLPVGSEVHNKVMERLYGSFIDPRDPQGRATLGRAPSTFAANSDKVAALIRELLAAEPDATPERRDEIIMRALKEQRAAVYFFDATFSVPKSVSLLHASFQVRAQQAHDAGRAGEAEQWDARAQAVWDAIMAANRAMLEYLQREAGYSRAGYHSKGSGRFADAHEWVIASFPQHTSRDNDPQLHVHNAILNRVLRDDPLAARPGGRLAWRTLDGAALYAARPAAGAIAERTLAERLTQSLGVEIIARADGNGWEIAGISEHARDLFSSRRRAIEARLDALVDEYERRHGKAPNARRLVDGAIRDLGFAPGKGAVGGAVAPCRDPGAQRHPGRRARPARTRRRGASGGRREDGSRSCGGSRGCASLQIGLHSLRAAADGEQAPAQLPRRSSRLACDGAAGGADRAGAGAGRAMRHGAADRAGHGASARGLPPRGRAEPWRRHGAEVHHARPARRRAALAARGGADRCAEHRIGSRRPCARRKPSAAGSATVARARPAGRTRRPSGAGRRGRAADQRGAE